MEKCSSEAKQSLSFNYFVNFCYFQKTLGVYGFLSYAGVGHWKGSFEIGTFKIYTRQYNIDNDHLMTPRRGFEVLESLPVPQTTDGHTIVRMCPTSKA